MNILSSIKTPVIKHLSMPKNESIHHDENSNESKKESDISYEHLKQVFSKNIPLGQNVYMKDIIIALYKIVKEESELNIIERAFKDYPEFKPMEINLKKVFGKYFSKKQIPTIQRNLYLLGDNGFYRTGDLKLITPSSMDPNEKKRYKNFSISPKNQHLLETLMIEMNVIQLMDFKFEETYTLR